MLRRRKVGFIFQSYNLVPTLTALDNIVLPLTIAGTKPDPTTLADVVRITGLGDRLKHRPAELSGGQQQRVATARALISRPEIIFADEPTAALDHTNGHVVIDLLAAYRKSGVVVVVTHDAEMLIGADLVYQMRDGRLEVEAAN